jgi:hypothetical protein
MIITLLFLTFSASAQTKAHPSLGIWIEGPDKQFFQITRTPEGTGIKPSTIKSEMGTPAGTTYYPLTLTAVHDGIPESDLITGKDYGPAILSSQWSLQNQVIRATYSNGIFSRYFLQKKVPRVLEKVEDALIDGYSNVFWIKRSLAGELRLFHQNARNTEIPLNQILFGSPIRKIRGSQDGHGITVLLENGLLLNVSIPEDGSLQVTELNRPESYSILDFEVGPIEDSPSPFGLISQGMDSRTGKILLQVHSFEPSKIVKPVALQYRDYLNRLQTLPFIAGLMGNTRAIDLNQLIAAHPSQLNRFLQVQYEAQEGEIRLLIHQSNTQDGFLNANQVRRRVILDSRTPGLCRAYVLKNHGLSPDLYLN